MNVKLNWLKELVDLEGLTLEEIVNKLSLYSTEVEGVKSAEDFDALASLGITNTDSYDDDVPF